MVVKITPDNFQAYLSELISLDQTYFPFPWDDNDWGNLNIESDYSLYIRLSNEEIIGFILYDARQEQGHLLKILVRPGERRSGLAKEIFNDSSSQEDFTSIYLEVATNNIAAVEFYRGLGFEILVERKKYYSNGQNAYAMLLRCD